MKIELAEPHGFCAGVDRALKIAEKELNRKPGETLYLLHEIVHNETVTARFAAAGAKIVPSLDVIPPGARLLISAHGAGRDVFSAASARGIEVVDATCPLVRRVQERAEEFSASGMTVLLAGDPHHREVEGILGWRRGPCIVLENEQDAREFHPEPGVRYAFLSQTTLNAGMVASMEKILRGKCPSLKSMGHVCFATSERQNAVRTLAARCGTMLIAGSPESSNTLRLLEVARSQGARANLISSPECLTPDMVAGSESVGIASGASAPESLLRAIVKKLRSMEKN